MFDKSDEEKRKRINEKIDRKIKRVEKKIERKGKREEKKLNFKSESFKKLTNPTSDEDYKVIADILLAEFYGENYLEELKYLDFADEKFGGNVDRFLNLDAEKYFQKKYELARDVIFEKLFSKDDEENKVLKQKIFKNIYVPIANENKIFPFLKVCCVDLIKSLKESNVFSKAGIKNELNAIYRRKREIIKVYLSSFSKAFPENLTEEKKRLFTILKNHELNGINFFYQIDYDPYFAPLGSYKCFSEDIKQQLGDNNWNGTIGKYTATEKVIMKLDFSNNQKLKILETLKENGKITNNEEELEYKKELDSLIITEENLKEVEEKYLKEQSSRGTR